MNDKINLYIMDISYAYGMNGVDRYLEILLKGLEVYNNINICWIHFVHDNTCVFIKEVTLKCGKKITIPLPQHSDEIMSEKYWNDKFNKYLFKLLKCEFSNKKRCIFHIHTLNLIDTAVYIKNMLSISCECKIITHLHCIPWKSLINHNQNRLFNVLYQYYYIDSTHLNKHKEEFITNSSEFRSYHNSDQIICVTQCAADFLNKVMDVDKRKITIIPNGINDCFEQSKRKQKISSTDNTLNVLYVGILSKSKGLEYILNALRIVKSKGYSIHLKIAGATTLSFRNMIYTEYNDLSLEFLGLIQFNILKKLYKDCDFGIIASLQEQCSYVAIEMLMFGLPIITTAVDGLDEMFTDNIDALKVQTIFSKWLGLSVDTDMMAKKIIDLASNVNLRRKLGQAGRLLYCRKFSLKKMIYKTTSCYKNFYQE